MNPGRRLRPTSSHFFSRLVSGSSSNGRTPAWHVGDWGSNPHDSTFTIRMVPSSNGQDAILSRWRCRVRFPLGPPFMESRLGRWPTANRLQDGFDPHLHVHHESWAASIVAMLSTFNRGSEVRFLGGPPGSFQQCYYGSGRQAGADPPRPPSSPWDASIDGDAPGS